MSSKFKQLPSNCSLAQFLTKHDDQLHNGFITRLDRSSIHLKRYSLQIVSLQRAFLTSSFRISFLKALTINIFLLAFMGGLASLIIFNDLSFSSRFSLRLGVCITKDLLISWAMIVMLSSTTVPFFLGECRLRFCYGFRIAEIVIRKPPASLHTRLSDQRIEKYWRIATRAVNPKLLYSRAGAMLSKDYWTLEYATVLDAYTSIGKGEFNEEDLEFSIWKQENGVWNACELWRTHDIMTDQQEVNMFKVLYFPTCQTHD
ncbi:uncharacterized protein LACBIDRAFT_321876 [Laccaria bicolor S238N-H82]|uniref:Predicted protein n=1 Tax=Laccaria bicolor (strain S238N-H82 / ATCC MYA-4686) TaxID=486041 RepID=B0CUH2_LACBS|nr:uncharacterized protein LACBIDRAFT_321876 [Laccaria bicolor S238N-H82]EDR14091.1 predicted protein [Laccaria bicolor S238N-H82]|eukprot:XP_001874650.1 predicted protein [Laccaria bicolor S238N-H82]